MFGYSNYPAVAIALSAILAVEVIYLGYVIYKIFRNRS